MTEQDNEKNHAVESALEKIRQAEADLVRAREIEERAKQELEEARRQLEEAEDHGPPQELYVFFVSTTEYTTDQKIMTGLQIKAKVSDWDPTHDLVLEGHGNEPDRVIRDDETINMHSKHGPLRFSSAPKANFGSNEYY